MTAGAKSTGWRALSPKPTPEKTTAAGVRLCAREFGIMLMTCGVASYTTTMLVTGIGPPTPVAVQCTVIVPGVAFVLAVYPSVTVSTDALTTTTVTFELDVVQPSVVVPL